jgi:hypothetical protein
LPQGSKERERDIENKLNRKKQTDFFSSMAKSLSKLIPKPIRMASAGILTFLKSVAIGGALLALLAFLDSDTWKDWQEIIKKKLVPGLNAMIKWFSDFATDLGEWFSAEDGKEKKSLLKIFTDNWEAFSIALLALAVLTPGLFFKGVYLAGKWLFVAPLMALGKALLGLVGIGGVVAGISGAGALTAGGAAARAAHVGGGKLPKIGAKFEQGGKKYTFRADSSGGGFVQTSGTPETGKGKPASSAVEKAGRAAKGLDGAGRWNKLISKFSGLKKIAAIGGRFAAPVAIALTGWEVYNILMGGGTMADKIKATGKALGEFVGTAGLAAMGAAIGGVAGSSFPIIGTILGTIAGGAVGYFGGGWAGERIAELMLGDEKAVAPKLERLANVQTEMSDIGVGGTPLTDVGGSPMKVPKADVGGSPMKVSMADMGNTANAMTLGNGGGDISLMGGAGVDTLAMTSSVTDWTDGPSSSGATGMPTISSTAPINIISTGSINILSTPKRDGNNLMARAAEKSAITNAAMQSNVPGTPIVNAPNIVNNNQSNTTVASKSLTHPSPLLNAVNFAYA